MSVCEWCQGSRSSSDEQALLPIEGNRDPSDGPQTSPEVEKRDQCLCPHEVKQQQVKADRHSMQSMYQQMFMNKMAFENKVASSYNKKLPRELKLRCPGDATVKEGEKALTVASVAEKYPYKTPMELSEDSGESLGSLEETPIDLEGILAGLTGGPARKPVVPEPSQEENLSAEDPNE